LHIFCKQLSILLSSGCTLSKSLHIIQNQVNNKLKCIISSIQKELQQGNSLSQSMQKQNLFSNFLVNMIVAGESSGNLDHIMDKLSIYYEKENKLKSKIGASLVYPSILSLVSLNVTLFLIVYVIPNFINIFNQNNIQPPFTTKILLQMSYIIKERWYIIWILPMIIILLLSIYINRNPRCKYFIDNLKLKIPYINKLVNLITTCKFSRSFYILISSGVQVVDAIDISSKIIENKVIQDRIYKSKENIKLGNSLYQSLSLCNIFPNMFISMINIGEESGKLDDILSSISDFYEIELESKLNKIVSLIEPIIILTMGLVIGGIVMSIMLPMFEVMTTFK
ncbi:MAG TPA: type II secretion system F family protein, partial [Peptostreptococcaceae bacterium]|nr:type II secretion system F family protein [Peptostreptococcaceae bacterium]